MGKNGGGEGGKQTHNNIQMFLKTEKFKKRKRIPELVLILLMVLKQVTFSGLKVSFSVTTIWERNLIISAVNRESFNNLKCYSILPLFLENSI